jgi:hypothetical protein
MYFKTHGHEKQNMRVIENVCEDVWDNRQNLKLKKALPEWQGC